MSKDLFSKQADIYAKYRPGYPGELIDYVLKHVDKRDAAWDCATGNGQAAILLAPFFTRVEATDISQKQVNNAIRFPNIHYSVSTADHTDFPNNSFDLVTIAQAYHWFNFEAFEKEVRRVLRPGGIVSIWGYRLVNCEEPAVKALIQSFYTDTVGPFWDPERRYVDDHYRYVPFPFLELPGKEFTITKSWTIDDLTGYLNTWSSVQHFLDAKGFNPVDQLIPALRSAWPQKETLLFEFPLFLRIGRVSR